METKELKTIYLTSNFAEQMGDYYLTESKISSASADEDCQNLTEDGLFEALIRKYTRENRGITLGHDFVSLEELKFFLDKRTQERENYTISCYIKSVALRNELKKLFGVELKMSETLVSMKPGDILFTIIVSNLKDYALHEYKEEYLPEGSKLRIKKWWIK